jgi:hypothetical protein
MLFLVGDTKDIIQRVSRVDDDVLLMLLVPLLR